VLTTQGTCLKKAIGDVRLDGRRCVSNHVHDVADALGIEAARATLLNEIRSILSFDGSYVNSRHMGLAVDWMTFTGNLTSFTRYGLSKMSDSTLKLCSFERVSHFITQGASQQKKDDFRGISAQLVMGVRPRIGTGGIGCFLDEEKEQANKFVQPRKTFEDRLGRPLDHLPEWSAFVPPPCPAALPPHWSPVHIGDSPAYTSPAYAPTSPAYAPTSPQGAEKLAAQNEGHVL
jgi:hypothetical protein